MDPYSKKLWTNFIKVRKITKHSRTPKTFHKPLTYLPIKYGNFRLCKGKEKILVHYWVNTYIKYMCLCINKNEVLFYQTPESSFTYTASVPPVPPLVNHHGWLIQRVNRIENHLVTIVGPTKIRKLSKGSENKRKYITK